MLTPDEHQEVRATIPASPLNEEYKLNGSSGHLSSLGRGAVGNARRSRAFVNIRLTRHPLRLVVAIVVALVAAFVSYQNASAIPTVSFTPPKGWSALPVPTPHSNGAVTLRKWRSPDESETVYIDIMPWHSSLNAFYHMLRSEMEASFSRYQTGNETGISEESEHCGLPVMGYAMPYTLHGGLHFMYVLITVHGGRGSWLTYQHANDEGGLMPPAIMKALNSFCLK